MKTLFFLLCIFSYKSFATTEDPFFKRSSLLEKMVPKNTTFKKSQPKKALEKASIWLTLPSCFLERDLTVYKEIGIEGFYTPKNILDNKDMFIQPLELYKGQESEFKLAIRNVSNLSHLYHLIEIKEKDWAVLPQKKPFKLTDLQVIQLKESYPLIKKDSSLVYSCTEAVVGQDHKLRRWVYPHYPDTNIPLMNFFDPSFLANQLATLKVLEKLQDAEIIELPELKKRVFII